VKHRSKRIEVAYGMLSEALWWFKNGNKSEGLREVRRARKKLLKAMREPHAFRVVNRWGEP
jgi:hypothetical protein